MNHSDSSTVATPTDADQPSAVKASLGLWDAVSIMIGIVIGTSIYKVPPDVCNFVGSPWIALGAWALGGLLSLIGALVYAELATAYPRVGGDYVYLSRAFGSWAGFLFGWASLSVIRSSSIGAMAFVFADYAVELWQMPSDQAALIAALVVVVLAAINLFGVMLGTGTQNVLSAAKVLGLAGVVISGMWWGYAGNMQEAAPAVPGTGFGLAMIFVLYAYGGWSDTAFVAAELRERRNILRSLVLGISCITLIYLAVNAAYLFGLGFGGIRQSKAVAADVLQLPLGKFGHKAMSVLVMVSALGAINGILFTGARVYATMGADHRVFAWLGYWNPRLGSPHWALLAQTLFALLMIGSVGTDAGRQAIDALVTRAGGAGLPWQNHSDGFAALVNGCAAVFWSFFLLTGLSYFVLRYKDTVQGRAFYLPVPLYPLLPLIFCSTCLYMLYSAATYAGHLNWIGIVPLLLGVPLYFLSGQRPEAEGAAADPPDKIAPQPE